MTRIIFSFYTIVHSLPILLLFYFVLYAMLGIKTSVSCVRLLLYHWPASFACFPSLHIRLVPTHLINFKYQAFKMHFSFPLCVCMWVCLCECMYLCVHICVCMYSCMCCVLVEGELNVLCLPSLAATKWSFLLILSKCYCGLSFYVLDGFMFFKKYFRAEKIIISEKQKK